jgi:hypothetical protein
VWAKCIGLNGTYTSGTSVEFEVLTAVVTTSFVFWDITSCSPLKVIRRFGGVCRLHIQGLNQREVGSKQSFTLVSRLAYPLTMKMEAT